MEKENTAFSSIDFVVMCLLDKERTIAFEKSIQNSVRPGSVVVELGTGSGILSLFAARSGAKKVIAVEYDPYVAEVAKKNIKSNGYDHIIEVVIADARNHTFPEGTYFDVVIAEMLTTGMVDEFQVQGINNLHQRKFVDENTIFIPSVQKTFAQMCSVDFKAYGFKMEMVTHVWRFYREVLEYPITRLGEIQEINSVDFSRETPETTKQTVSITISETAYANAIYLTSSSIFPDNTKLGATEFLNGDVIIPLVNPREVTKGEEVKLAIQYIFGNGYGSFFAEIIDT